MPNPKLINDARLSLGVYSSLFAATLVVVGCGKVSQPDLSDQDLRQRHHQCRMTSVLTTDQAVECKKIRRLCSERQARGETVCAESQ